MWTDKKILLVDDDADDQLFFVDAIKELEPNLECDVASNGLEALVHLENVPPPPSIIFLDLNMPMMNGFECLTQLKKINEYKEIPVIIFTTSNHPIDMERTISMGAKMFLTKPPDFNVLKNKLREILQIFAEAT
ncbi:MAG: response regulator [Saprospiraceae bacterium]